MILLVVVVSSIFGFIRGVTKELLSLLSWGGSVFLTVAAFPYAKDIARSYIRHALIADIITTGALFVVLLIFISIFNYVCSNFVKKSFLGRADAVLGGGFGILRGGFLLAAVEILLTQYVWPEVSPQFIAESKLRPLVIKMADFAVLILPDEWQQSLISFMNQANKDKLKRFVIDEFADRIPEVKSFVNNENAKHYPMELPEPFDILEKEGETEIKNEAEKLATLKPKKIEENFEERKNFSKKERSDLDRILNQRVVTKTNVEQKENTEGPE
jgi:membrane protein required for colicin V production